jgi:ABC-2 type transport system ATP-binding protein
VRRARADLRDPSARHEAWEVIKNLAALGKTVLLTTHYMDEAQYLADNVAVISNGRIVAEGPPATIGNRELARARIRYRLADGADGTVPPADLTAPPGPDGLIELVPEDLTTTLHRLTGWALDQHVELTGLEVVRPSLEDVYLNLTAERAALAGPPAGRKGRRRS